jgi:sulfate adenylyltransferase subunit 1 (EFTu-like GTPase family)
MGKVGVQFKGHPTEYIFSTDIELKVGDMVVCDTRYGLSIGEVINLEVSEEQALKSCKWIVQRIDMAAHEARLEKVKRVGDIKRKMNNRKKKLEEEAIYAWMAKEDKEMAALWAEYKELQD